MMKMQDLTNKRFGWITVLERDYNYAKEHNLKKSDTFWKCQCDCGKVFTTRAYSLTKGKCKSCGCFKTTNGEDLTNLHKGHITVLGPDFQYSKEHIGSYWRCQCSCGTIFSQTSNWINKTVDPHCSNCKSNTYEDLCGQQFNFLTVLQRNYEYPIQHNLSTGVYWDCKCICGNITTVRGSALKDGSTLSCGCQKFKLIREKQMNNITGQHFGKLIAIEPDFDYAKKMNIKNSGNTIYWKCLCECGETCIKPYNDLIKGKAINCPNCTIKSKGEEQIKKLLRENNIQFIQDKEYFKDLFGDNNLLRYDFILLKDNIPYRLIEFDGEQHFRPVGYFGGEERFKLQQKYDQIKSEYAKTHNLPLVRIPYTVKQITIEMLLNTTEDGFAEEKIK